MKTKFLLTAILLAAVAAAPNAKADELASENFNYADGDLVSNGGWVGYGNDQSRRLQVASGQAVINQGTGVQDVNLSFTGTTGTLYYGIDFSVNDLGQPFSASNTDHEYFAAFYNGVNGDNLSARIDIVAPSGAGDFSIGIASDDGTADAIWGADLAYGATYRAVVSYDQLDNLAALWINPVLESDTSILGTNKATVGDTVSAFALRQARSDEGETIRVDNLLIGTTFNNVVTSAVPEPSSAAILTLGILGLVSRRRRK